MKIKVIKIHWELEDIFFSLKKLSQTKVRWLNKQICIAETLVQSNKISEGLKPRKAASPVLIMPCPVLPCPVFVLFCPVKHWPDMQATSLAWPTHSAPSTDLLVFCDEMNVFVGSNINIKSGGYNVKKPRCFTVKSWTMTWQEASDGLNQCAISFCIRKS